MTSYERGRELSLGKKKWDTLKNLSLIKNYHFLTVSHFLFLRLYKDRDWNGFQGMIGLTMVGGLEVLGDIINTKGALVGVHCYPVFWEGPLNFEIYIDPSLYYPIIKFPLNLSIPIFKFQISIVKSLYSSFWPTRNSICFSIFSCHTSEKILHPYFLKFAKKVKPRLRPKTV